MAATRSLPTGTDGAGHSRLCRKVAIKVLRTTMSADRTAVTRFRREADNACALDHPGIVGIYDTGEYDAGNDTRVQQSRIDHDHTPHDRTRHDRNQDAGDGADDARPVPYIVLEYVDGDGVQAVLAHEGRHPAPRALEVTVGILKGFSRFAHRHGMVHRGLSPPRPSCWTAAVYPK